MVAYALTSCLEAGEANLRTNAVSGNVLLKSGFGCELPVLVRSWRREWSAVRGTTDPLAPFGVIALATDAGRMYGGADIGGMRWSQTANYGVLPNPAMPATFLAHAYDLHDPWGDHTCAIWLCCPSLSFHPGICANLSAPIGGPAICGPYCEQLAMTAVVLPSAGSLHSRVKRPLGRRLAKAALHVAYGHAGPTSGPTLAGCEVTRAESDAAPQMLRLDFDSSLLGGERLEIRSSPPTSLLEVLVEPETFCMQPMQRCRSPPTSSAAMCCPKAVREWFCPAGLGPEFQALTPPTPQLLASNHWSNRSNSPKNLMYCSGKSCHPNSDALSFYHLYYIGFAIVSRSQT